MAIILQKCLIIQGTSLRGMKSHTIKDDTRSPFREIGIWTTQDMLLHVENDTNENTMIGALMAEAMSLEKGIGEEGMSGAWP